MKDYVKNVCFNFLSKLESKKDIRGERDDF